MKKQILELGSNSAIYGVGSALSRFANIITLPLFTAYLSPEEYGILAMLTLLAMITYPIFGLGLTAAMGPSYFANEAQAKSETVWTASIISFVSGFVLMLLGCVWAEEIKLLFRLSTQPDELIVISLIGCGFNIFGIPFILNMQFQKKAKLYVILTLTGVLITLMVSLIAVAALKMQVEGMVWGQTLGSAFTFLMFYIVSLKEEKGRFNFLIFSALLKQGLPMVLSFAFLFLLMHSNRYILEWVAGLESVGVYSIGFSLGMGITVFTSAVATAWYPFFMDYKDNWQEAQKIFGKIFTYYLYGAGLLTLLFFLMAKPVVYLLTQPIYYGACAVVGLVAFANFVQSLSNFFLPGLYFTNEVRYLSLIQGFAVVLSLPINFLLVVRFGVIGAGFGIVIGNIILLLVMYVWNRINRLRYPVVDYEWWRISIYAAGCGSLIMMYEFTSEGSILFELIKSISFFSIGVMMVYVFLNDNERRFALSAAKKLTSN